ncbi:MAG: sugar ABC transporter permease, partial [Bifidobacterium sp.]|nr:sugar ABC transporter permease [Bifidobacterium sp.]
MATQTKAAAVAAPAGAMAPNRPKPSLMSRLAYHFERYWQLWILVAPGLIFMFLFAYVPMWGIQLAF